MDDEINTRFVEVLSSEIFDDGRAFGKGKAIPEKEFCQFMHIEKNTVDSNHVAVFAYSSLGKTVPTVKESGELVTNFSRNAGQLLERIHNLKDANIDPTETKIAMEKMKMKMP